MWNPLKQLFASDPYEWFGLFDSVEEAHQNIPLFKAVAIDLNGTKVCLSRTDQGFFAIQDACPHLGMNLSKGTCNQVGEIVCPWHHYRYNLSTGEEVGKQSEDAIIYPTKIEGNRLYIGKLK